MIVGVCKAHSLRRAWNVPVYRETDDFNRFRLRRDVRDHIKLTRIFGTRVPRLSIDGCLKEISYIRQGFKHATDSCPFIFATQPRSFFHAVS